MSQYKSNIPIIDPPPTGEYFTQAQIKVGDNWQSIGNVIHTPKPPTLKLMNDMAQDAVRKFSFIAHFQFELRVVTQMEKPDMILPFTYVEE